MARIIAVGTPDATNAYLEKYIATQNFLPHQINRFDSKIKVEEARNIRRMLSFKFDKLLIVLNGEITVESQNALLKCIEEADESVHLIVCSQNMDSVLPTVRSRCIEVSLGDEGQVDVQLREAIKKIQDSADSWQVLDELFQLLESKDMDLLLPALRSLLLDAAQNKALAGKYYMFCKGALSYSLLSGSNNVNKKVILEKIFLPL